MNFRSDYRLEKFIAETDWKSLPEEVKERMRGCFIDLLGALLCGTLSDQFKAGLALAERIYGEGEVAVIGTKKKVFIYGSSLCDGPFVKRIRH